MDIVKSMSILNLVTFILKKIKWDPLHVIGKTLENGQKKLSLCSARTKGKPLPRKLVIASLMQILNYERWHLPATEILLHISWSKMSD